MKLGERRGEEKQLTCHIICFCCSHYLLHHSLKNLLNFDLVRDVACDESESFFTRKLMKYVLVIVPVLTPWLYGHQHHLEINWSTLERERERGRERVCV